MKSCSICDGEAWVCEDHPDLPWDSWHQLNCGPGMPCVCSPMHPNHLSKEELKAIEELESRPEMFNGRKKKGTA